MARKNKNGRQRGEQFNAIEKEPYRVGYARPPKETQFKPNQSGNPKGRPRRSPTLRAVVEKVLEEQIDIREGERVLRMSNRQALVRTAVRRALNGDPKLLRALSHMLRIETDGDQGEADTPNVVSAADDAILADFIVRHGMEVRAVVDQADQPKGEERKPSDVHKDGGDQP